MPENEVDFGETDYDGNSQGTYFYMDISDGDLPVDSVEVKSSEMSDVTDDTTTPEQL